RPQLDRGNAAQNVAKVVHNLIFS
ncbi:hypothetical protein, partial [Coxiella burnetii]